MSEGGGSHYEALVQAAETVNKELGFFTDEESVEENDVVAEDVEREIWFLDCSLDYYRSEGIYPFGTTRSAQDFSERWVGMTLGEYVDENQRLRRRYRRRVRHVCRKGLLLDPRQQEAFDKGNRIWGSRSGGTRDQENHRGDPFARFPLLRDTFRFRINISDELKIPATSDRDVRRALAALGRDTIKDWDHGWKKIQAQELRLFLDKITLIRQQTLHLLAQIE